MIIRRAGPPRKDGPPVNREIRAREVRLIDENGKQVGIVPFFDALRMAEDKGLDLVEVNPNTDPPVCKIMDYGKYKYELQKKAKEAKKKQTIIKVKEIKLRPRTEINDLLIKVKHMLRFFEEGHKVKVTVRFRGRELAHPEKGVEVINQIQEEVKDVAILENTPKLEGRQMVVVFSPRPEYLKKIKAEREKKEKEEKEQLKEDQNAKDEKQ